MDSQEVFCPNPACDASGQKGQGNISVHSHRSNRYRCKVCSKTFSGRRGTPFHWAHTDTITLVVNLVAHGCPIEAVVCFIHRCALPSLLLPLLIAMDGLASYVGAVQRAFRSPVYTGKAGRPPLVPWQEVVIRQVVKQYVSEGGKRVGMEVSRRLARGTEKQLQTLTKQTQVGEVLNTAFIECLNATFRSRLACLARRTRHLARTQGSLHAGMYLVGCVYNFCSYHTSLLT